MKQTFAGRLFMRPGMRGAASCLPPALLRSLLLWKYHHYSTQHNHVPCAHSRPMMRYYFPFRWDTNLSWYVKPVTTFWVTDIGFRKKKKIRASTTNILKLSWPSYFLGTQGKNFNLNIWVSLKVFVIFHNSQKKTLFSNRPRRSESFDTSLIYLRQLIEKRRK